MAVKQTKRKAFNFLRSYFDVLNEIPEEGDKLKFLLSIINKQFLNEDPKDLGFLVNLCYESQRHAVEKSVKGWITANKTDLQGNPETPCTPPKGSPYTPPPKEEEEKEQVKEKEEDEAKDFDFDAFYDLDVLSNYYLSKDQIVNAVISLPANKIKDKEHLENRMKDFKQSLIEQGRVKETFKEFAKYFRNWVKSVEDYNKKPNEVPNPNNEKIITFTSNANPSRQQLPESEFLSFKERMQGGGYIFKIIE